VSDWTKLSKSDVIDAIALVGEVWRDRRGAGEWDLKDLFSLIQVMWDFIFFR
jgi:hypothetical protein